MATTSNTKGKVTVIGLGPMGQAISSAFLRNGILTTIWNRTASKADVLVAQGAVLAASPTYAVAANELVILSLTDYKAMYDILNPVSDALSGRVLVNLSSDTPENARKAAQWASERGAKFLTGGIMVPPPLVGQPGAFTFFSGPKDIFESYQHILKLIGDTDYRGSDPMLALLYYQALVDIMFTSVAGIMHSIALIRSANISAKTFEPYLMNFLAFMPQLVAGMADEVDKGKYNGELNNMIMMAAGMEHITHASHDANVNTSLPDAVRAIYNQTVAGGHGKSGLSSIIEVLQQPSAM